MTLVKSAIFQEDRYKISSDATNENGVREMLVESICEPYMCFTCTDDNFVKRSKEKRTVLDVHEKQAVRITLERQSYRCKTCGKTFFAQNDPYPEKMHVTPDFADFVSQRLIQERSATLRVLSEKYGVSTMLLSNAINNYIDDFNHNVYSVQECHTIMFYPFEYERKERCFVCGIDDENNNVLLGVLDEYNAKEIERFVSEKIMHSDKAETVFCDLNEEVIFCLGDIFPKATIAVNRQLLLRRLKKLIVDTGDGLYNAKNSAVESLEAVLTTSSCDNLHKRIADWLTGLHTDIRPIFTDIIDVILFHPYECIEGFKLKSDDSVAADLVKLIRSFKSLKTSYRLVKLRMLLTNEAVKNQIKETRYGSYINVALVNNESRKDYCVDIKTLLCIYG